VRAVVQRVARASVHVDGESVAAIGPGLLALVGVGREDGPEDARGLAHKLVHLRVFPGAERNLDRSLLDAGGELLVVSQFTLHGDARKGRRPSFTAAAPGDRAEPLVDAVAEAARGLGVTVVTGRFGAMMDVELVNRGPVTLLLDTRGGF